MVLPAWWHMLLLVRVVGTVIVFILENEQAPPLTATCSSRIGKPMAVSNSLAACHLSRTGLIISPQFAMMVPTCWPRDLQEQKKRFEFIVVAVHEHTAMNNVTNK